MNFWISWKINIIINADTEADPADEHELVLMLMLIVRWSQMKKKKDKNENEETIIIGMSSCEMEPVEENREDKSENKTNLKLKVNKE